MFPKIPTFVITLPQLPERTAYVTQHLAERGVPWKAWDGFPGVLMGLSTFLPYATDGHKPTPCATCGNETAYRANSGTVAVTLTHLAILKHIIAAEIPETLIFENDVELPVDFHERFEHFYRNLPRGWGMGYLGWGSGDEAWDEANVKPVAPGVAIVPGGSMQTHAYLISLKAARFLDQTCQQAWRPIDVSYMLEGRDHVPMYFAHPKIASQLTASGKQKGSLHFGAEQFTEPTKEQGDTLVVMDGTTWRYEEK